MNRVNTKRMGQAVRPSVVGDRFVAWVVPFLLPKSSNIRSGIKQELARIDSKEINWTELIANVERVGVELESEADEVRREKRREQRDSSKGDDKGN